MPKKLTKKVIPLIIIFLMILSVVAGISIYYRAISTSETETISTQIEESELSELSDNLEEESEKIVEEELIEPEESSEPIPKPTPEPAPVETPPPTPTPSNWWDYPANINVIPLAEVSHLSVVNKGNQLPSNYAPGDLIQLQNSSGIRVLGTQYVRNMVVTPLQNLGAAAMADGIDLSVKSTYRSFQTQQSTYQYWVKYNGGSVAAADKVSARPGHSEHQLGTVVDFSTSEANDKLGAAFNSSRAAAWLLVNAPQYGFKLSYPSGQESITGYSHEGWHWRYWGN